MRLSRESFNILHRALYDRFPSPGMFDLMCTQCHRPRADFAPDNAERPVAIQKLIEDCASQDRLENLIGCLKERYGGNALIDALDYAALSSGPSDQEVVDAGGGRAQFKERLMSILQQLDQPGMQFLAARELEELLSDASDNEARTLYFALLGNLKFDRPAQVVSSLVPVMAKVLRRVIGEGGRGEDFDLELDRTRLPRIDLGGLDLREADIAFADLRNANFDNADLYRVRGYAVDISGAGFNSAVLEEARLHSSVAEKTRFHNARMVSTFLKEADLRDAEFQQAQLQGAHFERANLSGAKFARANVSDAYLTGAILDDAAIASISRAVGWDSAHFDDPVRAAIEEHR